jgi:hypothetical protein
VSHNIARAKNAPPTDPRLRKRRQKYASAGKFYLSAPAKVVLCRQLGTILPAKRRRCRQIFTLKRAGKKVVAPANTHNVPANRYYHHSIASSAFGMTRSP